MTDTRAEILAAALLEFSEHGFYDTSVQQIANRVGITKTAVLYHFRSKDDLLAALASPLLDALEAAVMGEKTRWDVLEGVLDVWIAHRYLLQVNLRDLALAASGPVFERFRDAMLRANRIVAGPRPGLRERVRAAQAIAMLGDPVVLYASAPTKLLREAVLEGTRRLFDVAPVPHRRGRPVSVDPTMVKRLHAAGLDADQIAAKLGVSRATVYRHVRSRRPEHDDI